MAMTEENKNDVQRSIKAYAVSMVSWLIAAALLITAAALISFSGDDPDANLGALSLLALYASALIAGFFSAKLSGKLTTVIFTSLTVCAVVLLASSFKPEGVNTYSATVTAILYFLVAITAFLSGLAVLLIMKKSASKPRRKRTHRR